MVRCKWWPSINVILVFVFITACGSSAGGSNATSSSHSVISFPQFLQSVAGAHYSDYAHLSITKVQNEEAFEEMRVYILHLYSGVRVLSTYVFDGNAFDCVLTPSQPSGTFKSAAPLIAQTNVLAPSTCQDGSIPMERVTLERLVQFTTLQAFLGKSPDGGSLPPIPSPKQTGS